MSQAPTAPPSSAFDARSFSPFAECAGPEPDYGRIREIANTEAPFGHLVDVAEVAEVRRDGATAALPDDPWLANHVGTVHVVALFLVADVAGAMAFVGAAAPQIDRVEWAVVRGLQCRFLRPARGPVHAHGVADEHDVRALLDREDAHRAAVAGRAEIHDADGVSLAEVTFDWVCRIAPAASRSASPGR